jgi:hypothetical protein
LSLSRVVSFGSRVAAVIGAWVSCSAASPRASLERTFIIEIILDREPLAGEDDDTVQRTCELCTAGAEVQTRIEGLATILLRPALPTSSSPHPKRTPFRAWR